MIKKMEKHPKNNKYAENNIKISQKRKIYKTRKFAAYKKHFFRFLKLDFGPSTIIC